MEDKNTIIKQQDEEVTINAPRALWLEFLLTFLTLGFYSSFWFYGRAKEFNLLLKQKFTPWMWFFSPILVITLIFAFPAFIKALNKIARENNLPEWKAWWGAWTLSCAAISILINISDKIELPGWTLVPFVFIWSLLMAFLQAQVIKLKKGLREKHIIFKKPKYYLSLWEWLTIVPLLLLFTFVIYQLIKPAFTVHLKELQAHTIYTEEQFNFEIPIQGDGWSVVEKGTFSDGSSITELQGPIEEMYLVVFDHGKSNTLNEIAEWRIEQYKTEQSLKKCEEERRLAASQISVISVISCRGFNFTDSALITSSLIETEDGIIELYGFISRPKNIYFRYAPSMIKMIKGFEPK